MRGLIQTRLSVPGVTLVALTDTVLPDGHRDRGGTA